MPKEMSSSSSAVTEIQYVLNDKPIKGLRRGGRPIADVQGVSIAKQRVETCGKVFAHRLR